VKWWGIPALQSACGYRLSNSLATLAYFAASVGIGVLMSKLIELPVLSARDRWFPSRSRSLLTPPAE
jgi:peptidoglycan/LPS O-acetylase OafA/YrhL